jgi:anti-sigma regulatory factor (Ser/Thr protein kinase)
MARTRVRKRFAGVMADDAVSDLELVVTELVTNAIAASAVGQRVGLRFERAAGTVLIEVFDSCPDPPLLRDVNELALSGRGLALVKELSDDFGWQLDSAGLGKVVWALCPAPGITS